jgi:ABC-type nitrate/sulfonate/bicarbonate transport system permease component
MTAQGLSLRLPRRAQSWTPSDKWLGWLVPVLLLAVWEVAGHYGWLPRYLVRPSVIAQSWLAMAADGELMTNTTASLFRQSTGFLIGAAGGVFVGLLAGVFRPVERFYEPLISLTYPVPKIAILPLIFAWFGLGDTSKIIVIGISIFFPIYISAYYGAKSINRIHVWTAQNAGAGRGEIFRHVVFPSALPDIFNGLRIGLALSFVLMVTTELVVSSSGLGYMIGRAEENLRFDRMYVAILTIAVIGFCADRLLLLIRKRVLVGQLMGKDRGHE